MEVFIKDSRKFKTSQAVGLTYDFVLDSLDKETSTVAVPSDAVTRHAVGNWLLACNNVFLISQVKPGDAKTTLSLQHPLEAFTRSLVYREPAEGQSIGGFIAETLQTNWIDCNDPDYAIPYLTVSNSDTTPFVPPDVDSNGLFDLAAYCRLMRKTYGVVTAFSLAGSHLACKILQAPSATRQVLFTDGRSHLKSVDYGATGVAKITAIQNGEPSFWYLSESGQISQTVPERRAAGNWITIAVASNADVSAKVAETFAKNRSGHKVEFFSELDLNVGDSCNLRIRGESLSSYITCKRKLSGDNRFLYKAGDLATTASEKLRGVKK